MATQQVRPGPPGKHGAHRLPFRPLGGDSRTVSDRSILRMDVREARGAAWPGQHGWDWTEGLFFLWLQQA
jgi:hypothetical protein